MLNELISEKELKENVVEKKNFSWDVEKDAMEWEHALSH